MICTMDCPSLIVSNQMEEFISIQRVKIDIGQEYVCVSEIHGCNVFKIYLS